MRQAHRGGKTKGERIGLAATRTYNAPGPACLAGAIGWQLDHANPPTAKTDRRMRFTDRKSLRKMADLCDRVASKKGHLVSRRSVMPDHIHMAIRGNLEHSPEEIALAFMNNIDFEFGQSGVFRPGYYREAFGEYDMGAVRS